MRTFDNRIKQFLIASNIDFPDLVHLVHLRKVASIYQQLLMNIGDGYHDYIFVYTYGSRDGKFVACGTVFP